MVCYAYQDKKRGIEETYFKHIDCMLEVWDNISKYYSNGLKRILNYDADTVVKLTILSHDLGKLVKAYQQGKRVDYRHEVISAYIAYKVLPKLYKDFPIDVLANAVFLHHENITLSIYAGSAGERMIPLSTLRKMIEVYGNKQELPIECDFSSDPYYNNVRSRIQQLDNIMKEVKTLMQSPNPDNIYSTISEIVINATSKIGEGSLIFRSKVAALLHVLNVCDSVAATVSRGDERDEGTTITRRAFEGAELLSKDDIKCR